MKQRYVITDIHGNYKTFLSALEYINFQLEDELYLLGDYVDRGPNSQAVVSHIIALQNQGYKVNCIRGNHEQYMLNAYNSNDIDDMHFWYRVGGQETMSSYELLEEDEQASVLKEHLEWMEQLPFYLDTGDYLFVHAGINFDAEKPLDDLGSLIQLRHWKENVDLDWLENRTVVHGHTPMVMNDIKKQLDPKEHPYPVIDIDAGCFYHKQGFGHLCVLNLDTRDLSFLPNKDMPLSEIRNRINQAFR